MIERVRKSSIGHTKVPKCLYALVLLSLHKVIAATVIVIFYFEL